MYLALTYDHRMLDGREAVTFLVKVDMTHPACSISSFAANRQYLCRSKSTSKIHEKCSLVKLQPISRSIIVPLYLKLPHTTVNISSMPRLLLQVGQTFSCSLEASEVGVKAQALKKSTKIKKVATPLLLSAYGAVRNFV